MFMGMAVAVMAVLSLCACSSGVSDGRYMIYYTTAEGDDITYRESRIEGAEDMSSEELTEALLDMLFTADNSDEGYFCAKPENVNINSFLINDRILEFDFDSAYLEMTNVEEIILRAALVLTMIQQPDISGVRFTVEKSALTDSYGRGVGTMGQDNFVDILLSEKGMLKQETYLTVYFSNSDSTALIPSKYHFTINNIKSSMEEFIMQQLKEGPTVEGTFAVMDSDVEIISVMTSDGVCYVNFGSNFLEQEQPVSDEILIYSIVNSLCTLSYVNSVQFLVNGSSDAVLHTVIELSKPFTPNYSLGR